jgi:hypothetical protein
MADTFGSRNSIRHDFPVTIELIGTLLQARVPIIEDAGERFPEAFDMLVEPYDADRRWRSCKRIHRGNRQGQQSGLSGDRENIDIAHDNLPEAGESPGDAGAKLSRLKP